MPTAEELLANMSESVAEHIHPVNDDDTRFVIDPDTRQIINAAYVSNVLMQYDHNSERYTFEIPRYVEHHDMTLCNRVRVHYDCLDEDGRSVYSDVYETDDVGIDPANSANVICSWLVSRNATQIPGSLSFLVQYLCIDGDEIVYEWHSDIYSDVYIKPGKNNSESAIIESTDIIDQMKADVYGAGDSVVSEIQDAAASSIAEIEAKGSETLASIPEDYSTTHAMADEALRRKADAIVLNESGECIMLDDSSDCNLINLKLYGKTEQVVTTGKNLLNVSDSNVIAMDGYTDFTISNGSIIISDLSFFMFKMPVEYGETYTASFNKNKTEETCHFRIYEYSAEPVAFTTDDSNYIGNSINQPCATVSSLVASYTPTTSNVTWITVGFYTTRSNNITNLMVELGNVATSYEPYSGGLLSPRPDFPQDLISIENPTIRLYGKNMINPEAAVNANFVINNGVCTLTRTSDSGRFSAFIPVYIPANVPFTISFNVLEYTKATSSLPMYVTDINGKSYYLSAKTSTTTSCTVPIASIRFYLQSTEEIGAYIKFDNLQLELGEEVTSYEPYRELQTIQVNRTFRGIPVSKNGNFTDSNGQQWVCDEIDFERGKYIQRIKETTLDPTITWNYYSSGDGVYQYYARYDDVYVDNVERNVLSPYFRSISLSERNYNYKSIYTAVQSGHNYICVNMDSSTTQTDWEALIAGGNINVAYRLATPIETDLTSTELQAFRDLHTNATDTIITNNTDSSMSVKYVADLDRYIFKNVSNKKVQLDLNLIEANWVESSDGRYFTQVLNIDVRSNSEINLTPSAAQQVSLILDGIAMFVANENGVVTVYSIGGTPGRDITIPATETVVVYA